MTLREHLRLFTRSIHALPHFQMVWGRMRMFWFMKVRKQIRFHQTERAFETTIDHNLKSLKHFNQRTDMLIKPLSVIETMGPRSKLLIVGPRNEGDLFSAIGHGFDPDKVQGLDLISYSPKIDLGDMHETPYADGTFDAIVVGWTLSYSREPAKFAAEMTRIVRDGGLIAIGVEYSLLTEEDEIALIGYKIQEHDKVAERINSTADILALFEPRVKHVYFDHDAPAKRSHGRDGLVESVSSVAVIFSIDKAAGSPAG